MADFLKSVSAAVIPRLKQQLASKKGGGPGFGSGGVLSPEGATHPLTSSLSFGSGPPKDKV